MLETLRFHCGAPIVEAPSQAAFALAADATSLPPLDSFALGSPEYPDRSTTLLIQVRGLGEGRAVRLTGPGIEGSRRLAADGLAPDFWASGPRQPRPLPPGRRHRPRRGRPHRGPAALDRRGDPLMYVAVKGGERAIDNAHRWLAEERRGDAAVAELGTDQINEQLALAVDRVMSEGSCFDPELAALAIKQAQGDLIEAAFLLRAYRTTLPRLGYTEPVDTGAMLVHRRISATYKDLPGGQVLGPTFDYTHRLLDFKLLADGEAVARPPPSPPAAPDQPMAHVLEHLDRDGMMQAEPADDPAMPVGDLTREPLLFPVERDLWLQNLTRADEGFLLSLGYSTQRGFGSTHPFVGELRIGEVAVELVPEELGFPIEIGTLTVTECEMVNQFEGSATEPPQFTRGYGLAFGHAERRAMSMALIDRALRESQSTGEATAPAQDQEFVLYHSDNVQASGFVEHLKLPHYVDFQGELETLRRLRAKATEGEPTREAAE